MMRTIKNINPYKTNLPYKTRGRRVDDLLVVRLEGRPAEPADNWLSTEPPAKHVGSRLRKGCRGHCGGRRRETGVAAPDPSQIISHGLGPSAYCTWVGLGGSSRPLGQEKSAWRCGVQIRGGGRNSLWGVSPLGTHVKMMMKMMI